jgi:hypothetical protein
VKIIKGLDILINISLISWFLAHNYIHDFDVKISGNFIVGGWQAISMLLHAMNKWFTAKYSARHIYHWITFIAVITMPIGSFWILLLTAPFMALFYTGLCIVEFTRIEKRPMSLLK